MVENNNALEESGQTTNTLLMSSILLSAAGLLGVLVFPNESEFVSECQQTALEITNSIDCIKKEKIQQYFNLASGILGTGVLLFVIDIFNRTTRQ